MPSASMRHKLPRAMVPSVVLSREPLVESMVAAYRRRDTQKLKLKMIDKVQPRQKVVCVPASAPQEPETVPAIPTSNGESECGQATSMQVDEPTPRDPLTVPTIEPTIEPTNEQHQITNAPVTPLRSSDPPRDPLQVEDNNPDIQLLKVVQTVQPHRNLQNSTSIQSPQRPNQVHDKHHARPAAPRTNSATKKSLSTESAAVLLNFLWGLHVAARNRLERTQKEFEASSKALLAFAKENNFTIPDLSSGMPQRPSHPEIQLSSPFVSNPAQANICTSTQPEDLIEYYARGIVCPVFMTGSDSESTISDPSMMAAQAEMTHDNFTVEQANRMLFDHFASFDESNCVNDPLSPAIGDESEIMDVANGFDPLSIQPANPGRPHSMLLTGGVNHSGGMVNLGSDTSVNSSGWWSPATNNTATMNTSVNISTNGQTSDVPCHPCPKCGKLFKQKRSVKRHLLMCGVTYLCEKCGCAYKSENLMKRHTLICVK